MIFKGVHKLPLYKVQSPPTIYEKLQKVPSVTLSYIFCLKLHKKCQFYQSKTNRHIQT